MSQTSVTSPQFIEVSAPLHEDLVTWPGVVERFDRNLAASFAAGDRMMVSHMRLGAHAGTHIDAPCHFLPDGGGIETVPLAALIGQAFVVGVSTGLGVITAEVLDRADIPASATRILGKTTNSGWSRHATGFNEQYVAFDETAAAWCIERGVVLLGIDYLSIEPFDAGARDYPVHKSLLRAGVVVLESLDLTDVSPGPYDLVVLPYSYRVPTAFPPGPF